MPPEVPLMDFQNDVQIEPSWLKHLFCKLP